MSAVGSFIAVYLYISALFYTTYIGHLKFPDTVDSNDVFDYIIVGGGTAGCLVAARLSEDPKNNVLLIERSGSGNDFVDIPAITNGIIGRPDKYKKGSLFKRYNTTAQDYVCGRTGGKCVVEAGYSLGGGSNSNSIYARGSPLDYDEWEKMGATGWSYKDVLPFFKSTEKCTSDRLVADGYHGTKGEQFLTNKIGFPKIAKIMEEAASELGFIVNSDYSDGQYTNSFDYVQYYQGNGFVYNSRRSFLEPALNRKNLNVICYSIVTQILFYGKIAMGVKYFSDGKYKNVYARKEIIISAGAIETPKLLMLSGIGDKNELEKFGIETIANLPAVGKSLQDQVELDIRFSTPKSYFNINYKDVEQYFDDQTGTLTKNPSIYIGYFPLKPFSVSENDTKMSFIAFANVDGFSQDLALSVNNLNPKSKGYIKLASKNPFKNPIINPNYLVEKEDRDIFHAGVQVLVKFVESKALKPLQLNLIPYPGTESCAKGTITIENFKDDDFIDCYINQVQVSLLHLSSTCRMGNGKDTINTVVDPELKIIGLKNIRIIDASIMPHLIRGNPNAPVTMIAEKGAAMIKAGKLLP